MDFQAGLRARLLADTTVAAIVGTRVYWVQRPQKSPYPAVVLQVVSDGRPENLKGFDGARSTRVQADCYGTSYAASLDLARATISALVEPTILSGKQFGRASVDRQLDLGETVADGSFVHRQTVDFNIWHVGD